ncbi:MAG: CoA pyrophosphatase [Trueperaceae bacterium]
MSSWTVDDVRRALAEPAARGLELPGHGRAAVLVPLLDAPEGLALLFTVRSAGLSRHAGQIAFPGGRVEAGEDAIAAALREAHEEVGLSVDRGDVFGLLDDRASPFGLIATPVVARVAWPADLRVDPGEVAEVFTVPLALLAETPVMRETRAHEGGTRVLHRYLVVGRDVWGLTGNIVKDLLDRLAQVGGKVAPC